MERSEPALVPEWLKSSGSLTFGGSTTHQSASSLLQSDDRFLSKPARTKSLVSTSDHDIGRFVTDRTTSSYFRRSSSSNGSYHNFGRSNRDRDSEKGINDFRDKEKPNLRDYKHWDYSDPLGNTSPSRYEKDALRSMSTTNGNRGELGPRKVGADFGNYNRSNGRLHKGSATGVVHKVAFERDFPSLGAEEREATPELGKVSSPGLPMGSSAVIGGDGWKSALAEVPIVVGSNCTGGSIITTDAATSSTMTGLNMAETLAQAPPRAHTPPQLSAGTQRLEELAIKQSRQLIPMTVSTPKPLVLNPSEKPKLKVCQQPSQLVNHSPRVPPAKSDFSKIQSVGKLQVLKPAREKSGVSPTAKDSLSPTSVSNVVNNPLAYTPSVIGSAPLWSPSNSPKIGPTTLDKRPTSQAKSRNDFFNLMRKKSLKNSSVDPTPSPSFSILDKSVKTEAGFASVSPGDRDDRSLDTSARDGPTEKRGHVTSNGDASDRRQGSLENGKKNSSSDAFRYPEEEEAAFLRSLGWEENAGEDEGLTEEEINAFWRKYVKLRPSSRTFQGLQPKFIVPLSLPMESVGGGGASSGFSSSDSKSQT